MTAATNGQPHLESECLWCRISIIAKSRHGSARKFCSPTHRQAFWASLRRYGLAQLEGGHVTIEMLKGGKQSVHALSGQTQGLAEAGCTAHQIMAITGHKTLREVTRYTEAADRHGLAETAMAKIGRGTSSGKL